MIEALTAERDHYKEFWQAMTSYHNVMTRFQLPLPAVAFLGGPQMAHLSSTSACDRTDERQALSTSALA